jgi:hypothetical protein
MVSLGVGVGKDIKKDCSSTYIRSNVMRMEQALTVIAVKEKSLDVDKQLSK